MSRKNKKKVNWAPPTEQELKVFKIQFRNKSCNLCRFNGKLGKECMYCLPHGTNWKFGGIPLRGYVSTIVKEFNR